MNTFSAVDQSFFLSHGAFIAHRKEQREHHNSWYRGISAALVAITSHLLIRQFITKILFRICRMFVLSARYNFIAIYISISYLLSSWQNRFMVIVRLNVFTISRNFYALETEQCLPVANNGAISVIPF